MKTTEEIKEKLIKRLAESIDYAQKEGYSMDEANWAYEEGALITFNEAKLIIKALKKYSE